MKTFKQFTSDNGLKTFKTPSFFRDEKGNKAHLSGRTKTGKYTLRTKDKSMEFENDDILSKFLNNNKFVQFVPNAKDFNSMLKGKFK